MSKKYIFVKYYISISYNKNKKSTQHQYYSLLITFLLLSLYRKNVEHLLLHFDSAKLEHFSVISVKIFNLLIFRYV